MSNANAGFVGDGAIYVSNPGGRAAVVNSSIAYNMISGIRNDSTSNVIVLNSVLFFNAGGASQIAGGVTASYNDIQNGFPGVGNISLNPVFVNSATLLIAAASPCIDKGDTNAIYDDACFPPSRGSDRNDMGAYGGPGSCYWVTGNEPLVLREPKS